MSEDLHSSLTISLTDFETSDAIILYCSGISTISSNAWPFESSFFIVTYFFSEGFKLFFEFTNKFGGSDLPEKSSTYRAFILQKKMILTLGFLSRFMWGFFGLLWVIFEISLSAASIGLFFLLPILEISIFQKWVNFCESNLFFIRIRVTRCDSQMWSRNEEHSSLELKVKSSQRK